MGSDPRLRHLTHRVGLLIGMYRCILAQGGNGSRRLYHHLVVWLLLSCYILWLVLFLNYASIDVDVVAIVVQPTCDDLYLTSCVSYMLPYVVGLYCYISHCFRNCRAPRWYWKLNRSTTPRSLASGVPTSPRSTVNLIWCPGTIFRQIRYLSWLDIPVDHLCMWVYYVLVLVVICIKL